VTNILTTSILSPTIIKTSTIKFHFLCTKENFRISSSFSDSSEKELKWSNRDFSEGCEESKEERGDNWERILSSMH
jgi:hypothetical protein